jgi:hypothetical protein
MDIVWDVANKHALSEVEGAGLTEDSGLMPQRRQANLGCIHGRLDN